MSKTILYFGNIDTEITRNKVFIEGLRGNGFKVSECTDTSRGFKKYWQLYKKHRALRGRYDVLVVGYGGHVTVPLAKLISDKPVVFDALCSFYETEILSRDALKEIPFRMHFVRFVDWISMRFADNVLVESEAQKEYFVTRLKVVREKVTTVYTGVDERAFTSGGDVKKFDTFTVLFRGRVMSEAGVPTIIKTAKLLEEKNIDFLIIGYGHDKAKEEFEAAMRELSPKNVRHVGEHLPFEDMVFQMRQCHVSLGQFAKHERLERTIPHKAYESFVLKLPYVTARTRGIAEICKEGKHCLMVNPEDPEDLAEKILTLYNNPSLRESLSENSFGLYEEMFTSKRIVRPLCDLLHNFSKTK